MKILDEKLVALRTQIGDAVEDLLQLTQKIGHDGLASTISDLQARIQEPFMFVIVGEVKAGKSSFINALLDTDYDICKVAPSPMTDTIQQILYGETIREEIINPYLKRIYQPAEILKEIAIVDTPGTNTIIEHHQEITERFIPGADLIVFVFEAKNPYRQSAWEFFDYIHADWRKKIIFILQQKDLMETNDLEINIEGVRKQAVEKGIDQPVVFAVSAKQEQEGDTENSGYRPLHQYIQDHITGGKAPFLKLESGIQTAQNVAVKIKDGLSLRQKQYEVDVAFRDDIQQTLDQQKKISFDQVDVLVENLIAGYNQTMHEKTQDLNDALSFGSVLKRSFSSIFSKSQSLKEWLTNFAKGMEEDLYGKLQQKLNDRVLDLAESIQQMGQVIDLKIRSSKTILKDDDEIFSDIAEKRSKVLSELQNRFVEFLQQSDNFKKEELFSDRENMAPTLATGGGIAAVGVILSVLTNGMVFDITGGVLTAVGFVFAGVSLGLQKRKIMKNFKAEVDAGREKLNAQLTSRLKEYVDFIRDQIDSNFEKFDQMLHSEKQALELLYAELETIEAKLGGIEKELMKV